MPIKTRWSPRRFRPLLPRWEGICRIPPDVYAGAPAAPVTGRPTDRKHRGLRIDGRELLRQFADTLRTAIAASLLLPDQNDQSLAARDAVKRTNDGLAWLDDLGCRHQMSHVQARRVRTEQDDRRLRGGTRQACTEIAVPLVDQGEVRSKPGAKNEFGAGPGS